MTPVIDSHSALIVAHGSPSSPEELEQAIRELAKKVQALLPSWSIAGATLAGRGTLETAFGSLRSAPLIYPFFMSDGWFVSTALPKRLGKIAGEQTSLSVAEPLGLDPSIAELCLASASDTLIENEVPLKEASLVLAAHGSPSDPRPRLAAERVSRYIAEQGVFAVVHLGFVDEAPFLADAARVSGPAVCLPFFAMRAGHVNTDIPEALHEAKFEGLLADPIGTHDKIPGVVAGGLVRAAVMQAV